MGSWPETRARGPYPSLWACECTALLQTPFSHGNDPPASFLTEQRPGRDQGTCPAPSPSGVNHQQCQQQDSEVMSGSQRS